MKLTKIIYSIEKSSLASIEAFTEDEITVIISPREAEQLMMSFQKLAFQIYDYRYNNDEQCNYDEFAEFFGRTLRTWQECRNDEENEIN